MTEPEENIPQRPAPSAHDGAGEDAARTFAVAAARLLADSHCEDVLVFDVRDTSPLTHYLVIATGTSDRQIKGVAGYVEDLAREHRLDRYASEGDPASKWLVEDFIDVMVHLFEPTTRAHYDLEMLWGDAPRVAWRREEKAG